MWEVICAVRTARATEAEIEAAEVVETVSESSGVPSRLVRAAIEYWAECPADIDSWIDAADEAARVAHEQWLRQRKLLAS